MIVGYARVSTEKSEQDTSIEGQVADMQALGCDRVIVERRSAYKDLKRPGWEELLGLLRLEPDGFDALLVGVRCGIAICNRTNASIP